MRGQKDCFTSIGSFVLALVVFFLASEEAQEMIVTAKKKKGSETLAAWEEQMNDVSSSGYSRQQT